MRNVILKDLILNRNAIFVNVVILGAFLIYAVWDRVPAGVYAFFAAIMFSFLPIPVVTREDKYKAFALTCSLPVTRRTIVQARYVVTLGFAVGGVLLAMILAAVLPFSSLDIRVLFSPGPTLTALTVVTVITALLLPFTLRFGFFGLLVVLVVLQVLGVVLFTVAELTQSSADKRLVAAIAGSARSLAGDIGVPAFTALAGVCLAGIVLLSFLVSVRVFERREF